MASTREPVLEGLLSSPKYLPTWYKYDEIGSKLMEEVAYDNPFYYIYTSEWPVLEQHKHEMTASVQSPYVYMDLGCGQMKKSRLLIDTMINNQGHLSFYPVDISERTLKDACGQIGKEYDSRLTVKPVVGDFTDGFNVLRNINDRKFISCLGGTLLILPYDDQVTFLRDLSDAMTENDSFLLTMDTTNDVGAIKKAYLGEDSRSGNIKVFRNMLLRLNRDFDTNIDPDTFEFESQFTTQKDRANFLTIRARSKIAQSHASSKLPAPLTLERGEYIRMSSSEGTTYKYTLAQIHALAGKGGMKVQQIWKSQDGHIACVLLRKV